MLTVKNAKRSLPTLTEVVQPPVVLAAEEAPVVQANASAQLAQELLLRIMPAVQAQLRDLLQRHVQEQLQSMRPQLEQEMDVLVRQEVARVVGEISPALVTSLCGADKNCGIVGDVE